MFHMVGRLTRQQLADSRKLKMFSLILKKLTDVFIQFRIWSSLAAFSIDKMETSKSIEKFHIMDTSADSNDITSDTIKLYIQDSERFRNKLEKIALHLGGLIETLPIQSTNGYLQKNKSKLLPMIYPRFLRNNFEAQHFKNTFVSTKNEQIDYFNDHANANILLDDEAIDKLKETEKKINELLKTIHDILSIKHKADMNLKTFLENRNLKLLAAVYQCIPLLASFINTIESIDLTVFALIDKSAATSSSAEQERHDTLVSNDNLPKMKNSIGETPSFSDLGTRSVSASDAGTELSDETDYNSQSFYDATAKTFRPMVDDFIHLKQSIHSIFTDLVLDSQTITADDPESFFGIRTEKPTEDTGKTKMVADVMIKRLELIDTQVYNDGLYTLEPSLKLIETIKFTRERIRLIVLSTTQLKDERRVILNYCSRLMNTDFNVASLFIAERHNTLISKLSQNINKSVSTMNSQHNDGDQYDDGLVTSHDLTEYYSDNMTSGETTNHSIPWYMSADTDEASLVYEATTLRGGPIKGLVSKLINPLNPQDDLYMETFLCFFSTFMKPAKLFEILIDKYHLNMPEALSYEEYGIWLDQKLKPQQKRILEVFQRLFSKYWIVNYTSVELINMWESFVEDTPSIDDSLVALSNKVLSFDNQQAYIEYFRLAIIEPKTIPMSIVNNNVLHLKLQNLNVNYAAQQITAVQAFYFSKLNLWDLIGRSYNFNRIFRKKNERVPFARDPLGTKNISNFIKNCNNLTHYTTFMILKDTDLKTRVESIKYFITLAEKLLTLKNFSSMTAIISGLSSTGVSRLRKTWNEIPANYYKKFEKMDNLMSIGKNYSEYRNILRFVETDGDPYLPFLGMYLSDIRFTTDGNPDWLDNKKGSKGMVNFSKRVNLMKIIKEVLQFNDTPYNIKLDLEFSRYLQVMFQELPDDEKLYEMSINLEPRVSLFKDAPPFTAVAPGNSISSINSVNFSNIFGPMNTFGSISTNRSSQSIDTALNDDSLTTGGDSKTASTGSGKKLDSLGKRPRKYRPLLSLTAADRVKDKEKDKKEDKKEEMKEEKEIAKEA
jgi:son of sevenless-like protein